MEGMINKNRQRLEDCIVVLKSGRDGTIDHLGAMIAAKAIIDEAIAEHEKLHGQRPLSDAEFFKAVAAGK